MKAAGLIIALGILVTGADMACSRTQMTPSIERNDYGKGKKVEELDVQIGNKKKKVRTSVEVSERQYSAKEVQELFSRIIRKMDRLILPVMRHWIVWMRTWIWSQISRGSL